MKTRTLTTTLALALLFVGCNESAGGADSNPEFANGPSGSAPGSTGVSQGGAQDFGQFRQILEAGQLPAPQTLDALGFFAEHKLDYPAAECGENLCLHALLAVQQNLLTGTNCTLVQLGLNSPLQPSELERPPLDLVVAIDVSSSMLGDPIDSVRTGLIRMVDHLQEEDSVSVVTYSSTASVLAQGVSGGDRAQLVSLFEGIQARGNTNLFDGLATAFRVADENRVPEHQTRVIFLSDGVATAGLRQTGRLESLATAYAKRGIGITTIGVGRDFDVETMRGVSEVGAGNFYFLENPLAVEEVFAEEVQTFLVPVALDVKIELDMGDAYIVRRVYGTNGWSGGRRGGRIEIPSLFLAGRQRASDAIEGGRRGGGGGMLVEIMPRNTMAPVEAPERVGRLLMSWRDPITGEAKAEEIIVDNPNEPGVIPMNGYFTNFTVEKGFVMLNLLVGFEIATELARDGDGGTARGVLNALRTGVSEWLAGQELPDPDIEDDLRYVNMFIENLGRLGSPTPVAAPPEPWPYD